MDLSPGPVERKHTQIDALLFMHGEGHETLIDFQSLLPHSSHRPFTLLFHSPLSLHVPSGGTADGFVASSSPTASEKLSNVGFSLVCACDRAGHLGVRGGRGVEHGYAGRHCHRVVCQSSVVRRPS
jgi:hypothetical protein